MWASWSRGTENTSFSSASKDPNGFLLLPLDDFLCHVRHCRETGCDERPQCSLPSAGQQHGFMLDYSHKLRFGLLLPACFLLPPTATLPVLFPGSSSAFSLDPAFQKLLEPKFAGLCSWKEQSYPLLQDRYQASINIFLTAQLPQFSLRNVLCSMPDSD